MERVSGLLLLLQALTFTCSSISSGWLEERRRAVATWQPCPLPGAPSPTLAQRLSSAGAH
jgi:hypothetical protein